MSLHAPRGGLRLAATALAALLLVLAATAAVTVAGDDDGRSGEKAQTPGGGPLIIGHRGAAGYRPEHTLASYTLAARMGADYIEPDLVSTKDHVLVARHEPQLAETTDVASHPEFADRMTTRVIDGVTVANNWFVDQFTLAELKTLRAKERIPNVRQRNTIYDGRYEIPTFQEVIDLSKRLSKELHRTIGIYPETKHPTYFDTLKPSPLSLEEPLVATLNRNGLNNRDAAVFVQSFETSNLKELRSKLRVPLVQLFDSRDKRPADVDQKTGPTYGDMATPAGLQSVAQYADGVGPSKDYVLRPDLTATSFVSDAHAAGLVVHPYTFRNENQFLLAGAQRPGAPTDYGDPFKEDQAAFAAGVDGIFTDNADTGVAARAER